MIIRTRKGSRVKEKDDQKIIFERIEEFEICNREEAEKSLARIDSALRDIDSNIERINRHRAMLEYERSEIVIFIENSKKT